MKRILALSIMALIFIGSYGYAQMGDDWMDKGKGMINKGEKKAKEMMGGSPMDKGKKLFNDPKAFSGSGEKSCNSCHPDGKGLEQAGVKGKPEFKTPVAVLTSLEDTINVCIMMANKGKAIEPKSDEMTALITYIQSLHK